MTTRRALVTGASGFIGRALTAHLVASGWDVAVLVRDGSRFSTQARMLIAETFNDEALTAALGDERFDIVFHLAAYGVAPEQRDPKTMFAVNVAGTAAIVRAARRVGARALVYAGSSAEYREAAHGTSIVEDYPLTTKGLYGASKAAGGFWGGSLALHAGIVFQWVRIFGVFGFGEAPHRLFPAIASKLGKGQPVDLSPGDQTRDFLHVDDVVAGLTAAGEAAMRGTGDRFNLCSGVPVTVREIACTFADRMGRPRDLLRFGAIPYRPDENLWLLGDGSALRRATGFTPALTLLGGIDRFLAELSSSETFANGSEGWS
ncbi:MAG: NAD(P)-dependent oxidoreductase [Rhizobiaceae bacterium]